MSKDHCIFTEKCPVKGICFKYPEYIYKGEGKGCLFAHIIAVLEKWNEIKGRYLNTVTRLFRKIVKDINADTTNQLVTAMLILHDYGKVAKEYSTTKGYYHEILSASVIRKIINFNMLLTSLISSAVFLHHEHRIYRDLRDSGYWRIRAPVVNRIIRRHVPQELNVDEYANDAFITFLRRNIENADFLDFEALYYKYRKDEIEKIISDVVNYVTAGGEIGARNLLILGMLNHILVITDIRAANMTREEARNVISTYFKLILYGGRRQRSCT